MSQAELARRIARVTGNSFGVSYLCKIENDRVPAGSGTILNLAAALGADADHLLGLAGKPPADVARLLVASPAARAFYRAAVAAQLSEPEWDVLRGVMGQLIAGRVNRGRGASSR